MPPKQGIQFSFVNATGPKKSRREADLQLAEIRSHNTRIHHQRRREQAKGNRNLSPGQLQSTYSPELQTSASTSRDLDKETHAYHAPQLQYKYQAPTHLCPLDYLNGSADPFDSFGDIKFTSDLINLLTFIRTRYLACLYIGPAALRLCGRLSYTYEDIENNRVPGASLVVREFTRGLSDPKNAPGWVASHLPMVFPLLPPGSRGKLQDIAAQVRMQSFRQLRQDLERHHETGVSDASLVTQIVHMFKAGVMEDQPESAKVHAWALKKVGDTFHDDPRLASDLFMILMSNDTDHAVQKLQHPLLDYDHWLSHHLETQWKRIEAAMPDVGNSYQKVHPSVQFPVARSALVRLRRAIAITDVTIPMDTAAGAALGETLYIWGTSRTHHDTARLMERFLELRDTDPAEDPRRQGERYVEAAVSLTTVYCIRNTIQIAMYEGQDLRDASHVLVPEVKAFLLKALQVLSTEQLETYRPALFWMYACGAHYEERLRVGMAQPCLPPTYGWFRQMLILTASQLGITTWEQAQAEISKFFHSDLMPPNAAKWFAHELDPLAESLFDDEEHQGMGMW